MPALVDWATETLQKRLYPQSLLAIGALRLARQFAEPGASAMQRRFHRGQAEIHDVTNFPERATEHVGQDHAGALGDR